jgi:mannose-1-phosphate guanylyltransferase
MEKADNVVMIRSSFDWDDVGSWPAIERHTPADSAGNVIRGAVVAEESERNLVLSEGSHLIGLIGVEDLMVVHTGDATLICPKDRAQDVKKLVKRIQSREGGDSYL